MTNLVTKIITHSLLSFLVVSWRGNYQKEPESLFSTIYKSAGVVRYKESAKKNITLYNESGTVYAVLSFKSNTARFGKFTFNYADEGPDFELLKNKYYFSPLAFYPEYTLAIFDLKKRVGNKLYVYVDSPKKNIKYIYFDDEQLTVTDWKNHLLNRPDRGIVEIKFNKKGNPLMSKFNSLTRVSTSNLSTDEISWKILRFNGEWAELIAVSGCYEKPAKPLRGWVRWTDGRHPLLTLFYDC